MNARTLIITAGAIVVLAAPAAASARILPINMPSKHHVTKKLASKQPAKPVVKRQGQSRQIYIYSPAPVTSAPASDAVADSSATPNEDDC